MRRLLLSSLASALGVLIAPSATQSETLYHNGAPDHANGSEMTEYTEADDFELTEPTRLDRVMFWNFERANSFAGSFTWQIFANSNSDSPGALLFTGTSSNLSHAATGFAVFGGMQEYLNTFDLGPVTLPAGIYWVALHNGPFNNFFPPLSVFWESTANPGERSSHGAVSPLYRPWFSNAYPTLPSDLAFFVQGIFLPRITDLNFSGGAARISFTSAPGEQYRVEYSPSLTAPSWMAVPGAESVVGTGGIVQVADPQPNVRGLSRRFYRVVLL